MSDFGVFVNSSLFKHFKRFVWRMDENYILRLGGVQLKMDHDQKLSINPVYYPLFSYLAKPGSNQLTVFFGARSYVFLRNNRSFYIFKSSTPSEMEERNGTEP